MGMFEYGNSGKPRGCRHKRLPPYEIKRKAIQEYGYDYLRILGELATSRYKTDRKWFMDHFRKLLPKDVKVEMSGGMLQVVEQIVAKESTGPASEGKGDAATADDPPAPGSG